MQHPDRMLDADKDRKMKVEKALNNLGIKPISNAAAFSGRKSSSNVDPSGNNVINTTVTFSDEGYESSDGASLGLLDGEESCYYDKEHDTSSTFDTNPSQSSPSFQLRQLQENDSLQFSHNSSTMNIQRIDNEYKSNYDRFTNIITPASFFHHGIFEKSDSKRHLQVSPIKLYDSLPTIQHSKDTLMGLKNSIATSNDRSRSTNTNIQNMYSPDHLRTPSATNMNIREDLETIDLRSQIKSLQHELSQTKHSLEKSQIEVKLITCELSTHQTESAKKLKLLSEERDTLKKDINNIQLSTSTQSERVTDYLQSLEHNFHDEVIKVAEKVEIDAEKKISDIQSKYQSLLNEHERMKKIYKEPNSENMMSWKESFLSLLEKLCELEENEQYDSREINMEQLVIDAVGIKDEELNDESLAKLIHRLAKKPRMKKEVTESSTQTSLPYDHSNHDYEDPCPLPTKNCLHSCDKSAPLSIERSNFQELTYFSPRNHSSDQQLYKLQVEYANLLGTNEHLKEQISFYKSQLQSNSIPDVGDAVNVESNNRTMNTPSKQLGDYARIMAVCNELRVENARISKENSILAENQQIVEDENRKLAQHCIELERVSEDATVECERLLSQIHDAEEDIDTLKKDNNKLSSELAVMSNESYGTEMKLKGDLDSLQEEHDRLNTAMKKASTDLEAVMVENEKLRERIESLNQERISISAEMNEMKGQIRNISSEESNNKRTIENLTLEKDSVTHKHREAVSRLEVLEKKYTSLEKCKVELDDECCRLRNLNACLRGKIDSLSNNEKVVDKLVKEKAKVESQLDSLRVENISLSDKNAGLEVESSKLKRECEVMRESSKKLENNLKQLESLIRDEKQKQNGSLKIIETLQEEKVELTKSVTDTEEKYSALQGHVQSMTEDILTISSQIDKLNKGSYDPSIDVHTNVILADTILGQIRTLSSIQQKLEKEISTFQIEKENRRGCTSSIDNISPRLDNTFFSNINLPMQTPSIHNSTNSTIGRLDTFSTLRSSKKSLSTPLSCAGSDTNESKSSQPMSSNFHGRRMDTSSNIDVGNNCLRNSTSRYNQVMNESSIGKARQGQKVSIQDTEDFVMGILNSCRKSSVPF